MRMTVTVLSDQQASTQSDTTSDFLLGTGSGCTYSLCHCVLPRLVWDWYGRIRGEPGQNGQFLIGENYIYFARTMTQ